MVDIQYSERLYTPLHCFDCYFFFNKVTADRNKLQTVSRCFFFFCFCNKLFKIGLCPFLLRERYCTPHRTCKQFIAFSGNTFYIHFRFITAGIINRSRKVIIVLCLYIFYAVNSFRNYKSQSGLYGFHFSNKKKADPVEIKFDTYLPACKADNRLRRICQ